MFGFIGRLVLVIIVSIMLVFGGLLVINTSDDAHAGHQRHWHYKKGKNDNPHGKVPYY